MNKRNAFTLVELLVVIAIIGVLVGMLLPAVQQIRESARRIHCSNNIRQLGLALMNYESAHRKFPAGWKTLDKTAVAEPGWGWSALVLPYMEGQNLNDQINFNVAIDDPIHEEIIQNSMPVFLCPSEIGPTIVNLDTHIEHDHEDAFVLLESEHAHGELWVGRSNYSGVFGSTEIEANPLAGNGTFYANSDIRYADLKDGTSNTFIVGERTNELGAISWVGVVPEVDEPLSRIVGSADHSPNDPDGHFEDFRSYHPNGINVVMADGSVHFIRSSINAGVFQAMATINGDEVTSLED